MKSKRLPSRIFFALICSWLVQGLVAQEEAPTDPQPPVVAGPDQDGVVDADNIDYIKSQMNEVVIVNGTIGEMKVFGTSGNLLLKFEESDLAIFVRKTDVEKHKGWDLKALEGLGIYVAGHVKQYRDQLEIVITDPSQIAATPTGFDLEKIRKVGPDSKPAGASAKKAPKVAGAIAPSKKDYAELPMMLEEATVQTVSFYLKDTGMKIKEDPYGLPLDTLAAIVTPVTAKVTTLEGGGAMQVVFVKPNEDSKARVKALLDQLAESYGKWPKDKLVTIDVDFETRAFTDDPSMLVIATLVNALVTGKELPANLVVSGDVESDGRVVMPEANVNQAVSNRMIITAISDGMGEGTRYVCPEMSTDELNDFALDGKWEVLANVAVLAVPSLPEALKLIFAEEAGELSAAMSSFDQVQEVVKKGGEKMVKNAQVQERVLGAGRAWPSNKSAAFYAFYGRGKVPRTYSLRYTHQLITDLHTQIRFMQISKPADPKVTFRQLSDQLKEIKLKLSPDLQELAKAMTEFESEASSAAIRPQKGRGEERQVEKLKESDQQVLDELQKLSALMKGEAPAEAE